MLGISYSGLDREFRWPGRYPIRYCFTGRIEVFGLRMLIATIAETHLKAFSQPSYRLTGTAAVRGTGLVEVCLPRYDAPFLTLQVSFTCRSPDFFTEWPGVRDDLLVSWTVTTHIPSVATQVAYGSWGTVTETPSISAWLPSGGTTAASAPGEQRFARRRGMKIGQWPVR